MPTSEKETEQSILDAAAELIGERGYRGATTRAIAERAGVNEVTIFRHFGSKQGLLQALGDHWARTMAGFAVAGLPDPEDTRGTLFALARMEVRQASAFGAAAIRLAFDAKSSPEVADVMGGGPGGNFAGLVDYIRARQAAGDLRGDADARVIAEAFFALTSQAVMSRQVLADVATYELSVEESSAQLFELFWRGVKAEKGSE